MDGNIKKPGVLYIDSEHLTQYLRVYNQVTDSEIGYIGNISQYGIMLMTKWPIETGSLFKMYIRLPQPVDGEDIILFDARCQWCYQDISAEYYDSGYVLICTDPNYEKLMYALRNYFTSVAE